MQNRIRAVLVLALSTACAGVTLAKDCEQCHTAQGRPAGAADFTAIYTNRFGTHHPTGIPYPLAPAPDAGFNTPAVQDTLAFFDRNRNHLADADEVQVALTELGELTVECPACHIPDHASTTRKPPFLRMDNDHSELCLSCHRQ